MKKYFIVTVILSIVLIILVALNIYQVVLLNKTKNEIEKLKNDSSVYISQISDEKIKLNEITDILTETFETGKTKLEEYNIWEETNNQLKSLLK